MYDMHDWTLINVLLNWNKGKVILKLRTRDYERASVVANNSIHLNVPRLEEWGSSSSVNNCIGPVRLDQKNQKLCIEMQSGDTIEIVAENFIMPKHYCPAKAQ